MINVHLGSGIYMEMDHGALLDFCGKKQKLLKEKEEYLTGAHRYMYILTVTGVCPQISSD